MLITILFPIIDPFTLCAFCTKFGDNSVQNAQVVLNDRPNHQFPYTLPLFFLNLKSVAKPKTSMIFPYSTSI